MAETVRWGMVMVALMGFIRFVVMADAQSLEYNCSASIKKLMPFNAEDPCANSTAYTQLGDCGDFIGGNATAPSAGCCASTRDVWANRPACFCKVTFFSIFSEPGPARALARPALCNVTDDLCAICPGYVSALHSKEGGTGGHSRSKLNTASVVTVSVIVTLAVVGCGMLVYFLRKRALAKKHQSSTQAKNYVPQFNNM